MIDNEKEKNRLANLYRYNILDTPAEEAFDNITNIARSALKMPIAMLTLIDKDRQWFKSRQGIKVSQTSRDISFCSHTIEGDIPLMVPNLRKDSRFAKNPLVAGIPMLRFYCGVPLRTRDHYNIGSLCVLGYKPRKLNNEELLILRDLARLAIDEIELRQIADVDYLTGLATRRVFLTEGAKEMERARKSTAALSMIIFEIGQYKKIKEKFGESAGDNVLQTAVDRCQPLMKGEYKFARLGGEQFGVLMPMTSMVDACKLADQIVATVTSMEIMHMDTNIQTTCNVGLSEILITDDKFMAMYSRAEIAMLQSRRDMQGRPTVAKADANTNVEYSFDNAAVVF